MGIITLIIALGEGVCIVTVLGLYSDLKDDFKTLKGEYNHTRMTLNNFMRDQELKDNEIKAEQRKTHQMALYSFNTIKKGQEE